MIACANPGGGDSGRTSRGPGRRVRVVLLGGLLAFFAARLVAGSDKPAGIPWALQPVVRPAVPTGLSPSPSPIDAFVAEQYQAKSLQPVGPADRRTLLRRVFLDLTGLPPTVAEQDAFLADTAPGAYERVVDRLLASEQHAVRYARHWLDVLRYADTDEQMVAAPGIHWWRDWIIRALHEDLPYDQFVRAQLTGYRSANRSRMVATGYRVRAEPRPDDLFARGLLARGGSARRVADDHELAMAAVETVSTAFMGLTVGCAKCHDHEYDPITQRDFYAMKALFDPLVVRKVTLATATELIAHGQALAAAEQRHAAIEAPIEALIAPYRQKLYDDRVALLPPEVQAVIRLPEKERTVAEQKIADNYFPVLRIDPAKIKEVLPDAERKRYEEAQNQLDPKKGAPARPNLPAFWTVEVDPIRERVKSHVLTNGNPEKPETNHEVQPGWPFAPPDPDFREGRIEAFSDWLTAPGNPLFARVAVNRLWQWHFGVGLQQIPSDFGELGGTPSHPSLLDWLAAEFVRGNFSMKHMHRLFVTSETYQLASAAESALEAANARIDPENTFLWRFHLRRLEAEPIWDSIFAAACNLDLAVGGPSFDPPAAPNKIIEGGESAQPSRVVAPPPSRRAAYLTRGYSATREAMPVFLQTFDVDDGRVPCPFRTQTVTAPQALFLMNGGEVDQAAALLAGWIAKATGENLPAAIDLAYRVALCRPPSPGERAHALAYVENNPARLKNLAWLLFNLDEFVYVR